MSTENAGQRPPAPDYGIILNNDGGYLKHAEFPMSVEDLLERIYGPLAGTQVGALAWCVGVEEAHWPSDRLSMIGEAEGRRYLSVSDMRRAESLRAMFAADSDLYGQLVRRGHQMGLGVYASVRMNDNHFWSDAERRVKPLRPEEMASMERPHLTAFRKRHPEWVLGEGAPTWAATSWNMAVPEVREYTLQRIAEACELADWDGVELDWQRHAFHLPEEDAYRLRYTLTDLQRAVRRLTDAIAQRRGRPFYVIVRVGASRETNRRVGYDLETWIEEGLCDIVVTGANSGTDPDVEVEAYVEMMRGTEVRLYPGFDSHGEWGREHLLPPRSGGRLGSAVWPPASTSAVPRACICSTGTTTYTRPDRCCKVSAHPTACGVRPRCTPRSSATSATGASCATVPSETTGCAARYPSICCAP